jgi:alpha-N-arabinofuranosidase
MDMDVPGLAEHPWPEDPQRDDFDPGAPGLDRRWNFLRNPVEANYSLAERPGFLRLRGTGVTLDEQASPTFVGRRQQHMTFHAAATVDFQPTRPDEEAGLTVLANASHHYEIAVAGAPGGARRVLLRRRIGDLAAVVAEEPVGPGPVTLRVTGQPQQYTFSFSVAEGPQRALGTGSTRYLSSEVAGGFTGVYLGLYATGHGANCAAPADFDWFEYRA